MPKVKNYQTTKAEDPILGINEFEEEVVAILDLARKEAAKIIQEAKAKADEIIQREKQASSALKNEYLEKMQEELNLEKQRFDHEIKDKLQQIQNIPGERIQNAAHFILKKILPQEA